jgi:hypothetical protein
MRSASSAFGEVNKLRAENKEMKATIATLREHRFDVDRLADAIFLAHVDVMRTDTREWLNSDEAAAAIAHEYAALAMTKEP